MLRTALRPRMLGLLALVLAAMTVMCGLGVWQLGVARDHARVNAMKEAGARPVVPLRTLVAPHQPFPDDGSLRRVTATGHYDPSGQVLVTPRRLHGRSGAWVVTPLVVDATGARLAVLRGFVPHPAAAPPPVTTARVTVTGALAPGEEPSDPDRPRGRLSSVDLALLLDRWGGDMYNAFVFDIRESSAATGVPSMQRVPPPVPKTGLDKRNAAYAVQWWVFAAFAGYLYLRVIRDESRREDDPAAEPATPTNERAHV